MIQLERKGIPTATLCTAGFVNAGSMQASIMGIADLRIVSIPFPFATLTPDKARARGAEAVQAIVAALTATGT